MSTPMWDTPDHLPIPVTADGEGPATPETTDRWACWCPAGDDCPVAAEELASLNDAWRRRHE